MKFIKPLMIAALAGLPLAIAPAMAAGDSAESTSTSATSTPPAIVAAPSGTTYSQTTTMQGAHQPGTPSQLTPPNAPAKASGVGAEGSGGK